MKLDAFVFSVCFSLWGLFSQSEGANVWSGKAQVTAIQGESATLAWNVTLTGSDVSNVWVYVKILHAEGANTEELVTFKKKGGKTIDNPSYKSRLSDITFNVSQSGAVVAIQFKMANLVRTTDMRSYKAVLGFSNDASTYPGLTTLTVLVKPHSTEFKIKPSKNTFCLGDKVNFTCKADGFPPAQVSLLLNNQLLQRKNTSVTLTLSLNVMGENNFICVPKNTAGIGQTKTVKLDVKEPPKIVTCRINDEEVTSKSVIEGTKVTLSCQVTGSEPLNITWSKENLQKSPSKSNTLTFDSISQGNSGQYRVTVSNGRECETTVTKILHVTVMYLNEPQVIGKKYKVVSSNDPKAQFKVIVDGNPRPRLTCRREGGSRSSFSNHSTAFQVLASKWRFFVYIFALGNEKYYCDVSNAAGNRLIKFQLYKQGPPTNINGTFILTNETWREDLQNASSDAFFVLRTKINQALKFVYENEEFVTAWRVLAFVKGSVAVNFQLDVIANVTDPIILLKNAVDKNGGKLNGLAINRNSIKTGYSSTTKDAETAGKTTESDDKTWLYVGIVVGIFLLLLVLALVVVLFRCWYKRRDKKTSGRESNETSGMEITSYDGKPSANTREGETLLTPPRANLNPGTGKNRKAPHCKICGEPRKGHKKGKCDGNSPIKTDVEVHDFKVAYNKEAGNVMISVGLVKGPPEALKECANTIKSIMAPSQTQLPLSRQQSIGYGRSESLNCDFGY